MTVTTTQPRPAAVAPWATLAEAVRQVGQYRSTADAESVSRTVLLALAAHLPTSERETLAALLPADAAETALSKPLAPRPLTAREFVESLAPHIENATPATARWHVTSVLTALRHHLGTPRTARLLDQLPPGYALLFGVAELLGTAA
ncbi:DUF2267 domain-containing protein [Streptomyces sp. NBC_01601]|uniref:DUF2267 domain-containing protein n=1 Tax=Streptomyces sp. NBC_01601 TaxID=2975892 RepID=UPI002E2989AC|nr:DUF2267 domain-containing protein [Streptomyces sp. NBC_01601]